MSAVLGDAGRCPRSSSRTQMWSGTQVGRTELWRRWPRRSVGQEEVHRTEARNWLLTEAP